MKQLGYIGIDQYGTHYNIDKYPRKELMDQTGCTHVSKRYCDTTDKKQRHVGYVMGSYWIDVYRVFQWKESE